MYVHIYAFPLMPEQCFIDLMMYCSSILLVDYYWHYRTMLTFYKT